MAKASDNVYPKLIVSEGTVPASPSAGQQKLYLDSADHKLKRVNSAGTVTTIEGGGGGGSTWDHPTSLALSTLTGWTVGSGTWSIISSVINQSSTAASPRRLHLDAIPPLAQAVAQVDIKVNTLGATTTARAGIMFGTPATSDGGNSDLFYLASNGSTAQVAILSSERDGTAAYATVNLAAPIATGTWTTVRIYKSGRDFTVWINGTLLTTIQASAAGTAMGRFALYTYQADASFRNLDLWTPTMPV